ncbi:hypothetical protein [Streptomyces violaceorubidus]|uniref:Uncharacterized protein n=1 Tax=Streptomyces violaceorubidus TaxID=284042 RepID=A0ABV1SPX1_9ACTN
MSSDTLAESAAVPDTPGRADLPRIVPRRRSGQGTAAVVLVLLGIGQYYVEKHYARGAERTR